MMLNVVHYFNNIRFSLEGCTAVVVTNYSRPRGVSLSTYAVRIAFSFFCIIRLPGSDSWQSRPYILLVQVSLS